MPFNTPYSEQGHDIYESEAVCETLAVLSMGFQKTCMKHPDHL